MLSKILPDNVYTAIDRIGLEVISEIRIRDDKPIMISVATRKNKLKDALGNVIVAEQGTAEKIVAKATEYSLYSVNNQIIQGFITIENGIRIGLCGEVVWENNTIKTIKHINSINIRIAHDFLDCANVLLKYIYMGDTIHNTLIISPPGKGKTTMLRAICRKLSNDGNNVLLVDERNEIAAVKNGVAYFNIGENTDIITNTDKKYAFECGIRSMSPDIIITDEIMSEHDVNAVINASAGGVIVIASIHSSCPEELMEKQIFKTLFASKSISRYVFLSGCRVGKIEHIYDRNMKALA